MSTKVEVTKELLFEKVKTYINEQNSLKMIEKAYDFASDKHKNQFRKSGEPYFNHALNVAYILANLQAGPQTICGGLLHDTMEDCGVSYDEIKKEFDEEVAKLVEGVSKIGSLKFQDEKEYLAANHRKIFIAMAKDVRVIIIKLSDRLHNMRTLMYHTEEKQKKIASETLNVYAPIAHRLGLAEMKNELEDLAFMYTDYEKYHEIANLLEAKKSEREEVIKQMIVDIDKLLSDKKLVYRIFGRSKHIYSIYRKMERKNRSFEEIYDLYAIRVITQTELNCYEILGHIHNKYRPVPNRLKDYIAVPKPNMYQSLHTSILDNNGHLFEVQIRTEKMNDIAEMGVAAHWAYKEGKYNSKAEQKEIENKLSWFHDMIGLLDDLEQDHPTDLVDKIQKDIFEANVYAMTPKGRVIELPNGSTPLDFAYRVHTEIGHTAVGAIVNGAHVPLNTVLNTGDVVNIRTNKNTGPSEDWLKIVKSATARNKIKSYLMKKENELRVETIEKGEKLFAEELKKRNLDEKIYFDKNKLESIYKEFSSNNYNEFMYAVGNKSISLQQAVDKLSNTKGQNLDNEALTKLFQQRMQNKPRTISAAGVVVEGIDSMMVNIAGCCMPVNGDEIVGFITRGQGIKVHRTECPNIANEKNRLIEVKWDSDGDYQYDSWLRIDATDRNYLISDIITLISQFKISLNGINSEVLPDRINVYIDIKIKVKNLDQLTNVMANLKKINSVVNVTRIIR
ncbi:MAG: bifunctional (p)ppGpp synthetase/guanosine-3',5'-bis(diphosphate) 3'-pyrophosphohydrolase [Erysipelotrichia bacterium]|nr:bifunctional (p)ppGpp synthetase/guanosine-3',5'-bis(diphosphate) 3'-pyrophosphohydrolase [Erysipelotrichia bacterium]